MYTYYIYLYSNENIIKINSYMLNNLAHLKKFCRTGYMECCMSHDGCPTFFIMFNLIRC